MEKDYPFDIKEYRELVKIANTPHYERSPGAGVRFLEELEYIKRPKNSGIGSPVAVNPGGLSGLDDLWEKVRVKLKESLPLLIIGSLLTICYLYERR
ncbi:MAG: hypothetical protein QXT73_06915 [Candidatus Methanomethylicaceae archaeon]